MGIPKHKLDEKEVLVLTVGCINYDHDINHFEPIQRIFPRTQRYNYYQRFLDLGRGPMNEELLRVASAQRPDYVFYITYQNQVMLRTLERLRKGGAIFIGWFSDDQWRFDAFSQHLAKYLDFPITTWPIAYDKYRRLGFHPVFCQWGSNRRYYKPTKGAMKRYDVSFVGGGHGGRYQFLDTLREEGIEVSAFGRGWNKMLSFDDMIRVFSESKVNLNFSTSSVDMSVKQIKGRVFEIPMCRGFLLTEYVEGLEEWFEIDQEIVCFTDVQEAAQKIQYYLAHEEDRDRIAEAGYRRAVKCHSWDSRLMQVFTTIQDMEEETRHHVRPGLLESLGNRVFRR